MTSIATWPADERGLLFGQAEAALGITAVVVEKDFWVCWLLGRLFETRSVGPHVVFKGGTSLAKVFHAISRFSEDVDLSIAPARLGFDEQGLDAASTGSRREKDAAALEQACARHVAEVVSPALDATVTEVIGPAAAAEGWFRFELDAARAPVLWFHYPSALPQPGGYVAKVVKLEFGSLTNQRPSGTHRIRPLAADFPSAAPFVADESVVALEVERTFWEKATILHAEFHRPAELAQRDRYSRHYADFASLWQHSSRVSCLARTDLLAEVTRHKRRFFASRWASYDTARLGTLRLSPPASRHATLKRDLESMRPMFLAAPPTFDGILRVLAEAESTINAP